MCIRYSLTASCDELIREFGVEVCPQEYPTGYNISPFQFLPVVLLDQEGKRVVRLQWWGLVPAWAQASHKVTHINVRAETLGKKPSFRDAYRERRCIVPASGFFEWAQEGIDQQPNYVQPVAGNVMGIAGIWQASTRPDGSAVENFSILTIHANESLMPIYNRMPLVLDREDYRAWLAPETSLADLARMAHPCAPEKLLAYPVSPAVNRAENDSPEVIKPLRNSVV
jgi:putative SOS response-associated peptidase YedK